LFALQQEMTDSRLWYVSGAFATAFPSMGSYDGVWMEGAGDL